MRSSEKGNILFLILLAVVLFAALAYAVTSSMRGGGKDASSENLQNQVSSILGFFSQLDGALMRMQMAGGLKFENISLVYRPKLYNGTFSTSYTNGNCTVTTCQLFHIDGGAATAQSFEAYAVKEPTSYSGGWIGPGYYDYAVIQWPGAGTEANDVALRMTAMPRPLCNALNAQLGISTPTVSGPFVAGQVPSNWDNPAYTITGNSAQLIGQTSFASNLAYSGSPGEYCNIYHLLYTR